MYQQYGVPNSEAALLTSLFMLPWTIKPLFSPFLEKRATKKKLTLYAQASLSLLFMAMAFCVDAPCFLGISALGFFLLAFLSSLHDIVSDGVYIINLNQEEQKKYVAFRSFFYQMGRLIIKGGLLALIGALALHYAFNVWRVFFSACSFWDFLSPFTIKLKFRRKSSRLGQYLQNIIRCFRHCF